MRYHQANVATGDGRGEPVHAVDVCLKCACKCVLGVYAFGVSAFTWAIQGQDGGCGRLEVVTCKMNAGAQLG